MRTRAERRWFRFVKGMRRLKEDRQQHTGTWRTDCPCWAEEAGIGRGRVFARFADTPKQCSCWMCGNPRRYYKAQMGEKLTLQERRAFQPDERRTAMR